MWWNVHGISACLCVCVCVCVFFFWVGFHAPLMECMNGFCSFDCGEMFRFLSLSNIHTRFYIVLKGWDLFNLISCAHWFSDLSSTIAWFFHSGDLYVINSCFSWGLHWRGMLCFVDKLGLVHNENIHRNCNHANLWKFLTPHNTSAFLVLFLNVECRKSRMNHIFFPKFYFQELIFAFAWLWTLKVFLYLLAACLF